MSSDTEHHSSGLIYFMPAWLFESDGLSNTEKLVYSLLSGLAHGNEHKECWPTNAYIGKRLKICPKHAGECVGALEKFGAISKRTLRDEKNPFKLHRFITVHLSIQKSFTHPEKSGYQEPGISGSTHPEKSGSSNKGIRSKEVGRVDKSTQPKVANATPSAEASELCEYFSSALIKKKPNARLGNKALWVQDCEKLLKIRTLQELKILIDWMVSQDKALAYIQCPKKLYQKLDQQEMFMMAEIKRNRVNDNRFYCLFMKNQMPKELSKMSFDKEFVYNQGEGTGMALNVDPEEFKASFMKLWEVNNGRSS